METILWPAHTGADAAFKLIKYNSAQYSPSIFLNSDPVLLALYRIKLNTSECKSASQLG